MTRIALICALFALAGCGNKGPLVMADPATGNAAQAIEAPLVVPPAEPAAIEPAPDPVPAEPVPSTSDTPAR